MKSILKHVRKKEWILLSLICVLALVQVWMDIAIPDRMNRITTMLKTPGSTVADVTSSGAGMFGMAILSLLSSIVTVYLSAVVGAAVAMRVRGAIFDKTLDFSMEEMNRFKAAVILVTSGLLWGSKEAADY